MATELIFPNDNDTWDNWSPYSYTNVIGECSTAAAVNTGALITATLIYECGDMVSGDVDEVTSIAVRIHAKKLGFPTLKLSLYIAGGWTATQSVILTTSYAYYTKTFVGSWTKTQVDAMQIQAYCTGVDDSIVYIACMQATITYTPFYSKVINGVSGYTHINGIAVNDITAWNGVT